MSFFPMLNLIVIPNNSLIVYCLGSVFSLAKVLIILFLMIDSVIACIILNEFQWWNFVCFSSGKPKGDATVGQKGLGLLARKPRVGFQQLVKNEDE